MYLKGSTESSMPGHTTQDLNHWLGGILGLLKAPLYLFQSQLMKRAAGQCIAFNGQNVCKAVT